MEFSLGEHDGNALQQHNRVSQSLCRVEKIKFALKEGQGVNIDQIVLLPSLTFPPQSLYRASMFPASMKKPAAKRFTTSPIIFFPSPCFSTVSINCCRAFPTRFPAICLASGLQMLSVRFLPSMLQGPKSLQTTTWPFRNAASRLLTTDPSLSTVAKIILINTKAIFDFSG